MELLTGFQNVKFLAFRVDFSATFHKNCVIGEIFGTTACLRTVAGGKQGHVPCEIFSLQQSLLFVLVEFNVDHTAYSKMM